MEKDYLIAKWLKNELTEDEQNQFNELEDASLNRAIIDNAQNFKAAHFSTPKDFRTLEKRIAAQATPVRKLSWKRTLLQIASVVVLGFAVYYGFFYNQLTTIQTLASEKTSFTLPDASEVTLNAASEISYNEDNWNNKRSLRLEGEAFFKVAKGEKFDVVTSQGTVSVLGTQFNVKQRDSFFEITCYEGVVQVQTTKKIEKLMAGDSFRMDKDSFLTSRTNDVAPKWTTNISTFKSVPLYRVIGELERQYNVTITYKGVKQNELFTGGFVHDNLDNALQAITTPLDLTYSTKETNLIIVTDR
ncbi:DUF4974 domain-containing protein [Rasiella rasia]|uniref:DUF4974 domain-containing protein n=1 Tax=Rasiella rasia TaxID=2744027 RepID=A0A6G6GMH0_9FLAO|nr:FecR domain-containing protein [Rasiella rasia]QIE59717.1 DUF4974 domain-containing protein [Rasiella rasia]